MRTRFVDSETNERLVPDSLLIDGQDFSSSVTADGKSEVAVAGTIHHVIVARDGYETAEALLRTDEGDGEVVEFRLLPSNWQPPAEPAFSPDEGRIDGYVRDGDSGRGLPGAVVRLVEDNMQATADSDGYFQLAYLAPFEDASADPPRIKMSTLLVTAVGYVSQERRYVRLYAGTSARYLISLVPGAGPGADPEVIDERFERAAAAAEPDQATVGAPVRPNGTPDQGPLDDEREGDQGTREEPPLVAGVTRYIRVGFNCACRSCSRVVVMALENYSRHVLPAEWITSWSMNALQAGAVAVRSYGASFIRRPISSRYDICSNPCCQAYSSATYSRTDQAVRATRGLYVLTRNGLPFRAEYSSENNLAGPCNTDCYTGPCLRDRVCCGRSTRGHGRGMCQWGSQRWGSGAPRSGGRRSRTWILNHYYINNPGYQNLALRLGQR